jgi:hypothetical protein
LRTPPKLPERPGWRDYYQVVTTFLMLGLGAYVLWQTIFIRWALPSLILAVAFLLYGFLRVRMIWTYFRERGGRHGL